MLRIYKNKSNSNKGTSLFLQPQHERYYSLIADHFFVDGIERQILFDSHHSGSKLEIRLMSQGWSDSPCFSPSRFLCLSAVSSKS